MAKMYVRGEDGQPVEAEVPISQASLDNVIIAIRDIKIAPPIKTYAFPAPAIIGSEPVFNVAPSGQAQIMLPAGASIIKLPEDQPVTTKIELHGGNHATNITILGGCARPAALHDPVTMKLLNGSDYGVYTKIGFTGASGGRFKFTLANSGPVELRKQTDWLSWDVTPAGIQTAIDEVLGPDSCFVAGPSTPGGNKEWKLVPRDNRLGRATLISELTGTNVSAPAHNGYLFPAAVHALNTKFFKGRLHIENFHSNGITCLGDGWDVWTHHGGSEIVGINCLFEGRWHLYHDDWIHPDGLQALGGPAKLFFEKVTLKSKGGNCFIGQPRESPVPVGNPPVYHRLEKLFDWVLIDVNTVGYLSDDQILRKYFNTSCFVQEDDYPANGQQKAGWRWQMTRCFANIISTKTGEPADIDPKYYWNHSGLPKPEGLTIKADPPGGDYCKPEDCGIGKTKGGPYSKDPLPFVQQRLEGETVVVV